MFLWKEGRRGGGGGGVCKHSYLILKIMITAIFKSYKIRKLFVEYSPSMTPHLFQNVHSDKQYKAFEPSTYKSSAIQINHLMDSPFIYSLYYTYLSYICELSHQICLKMAGQEELERQRKKMAITLRHTAHTTSVSLLKYIMICPFNPLFDNRFGTAIT